MDNILLTSIVSNILSMLVGETFLINNERPGYRYELLVPLISCSNEATAPEAVGKINFITF